MYLKGEDYIDLLNCIEYLGAIKEDHVGFFEVNGDGATRTFELMECDDGIILLSDITGNKDDCILKAAIGYIRTDTVFKIVTTFLDVYHPEGA